MPYSPSNLSALAYANGFTLWHYKTSDRPEEVAYEPTYFALAASMLRPGDKIICNTNIHSRLTCFDLFVTDVVCSSNPYVETSTASNICQSCLIPASA